MPNFNFQTPFEKDLNLKYAVNNKKTVIAFLRYYGCRTCQLDLISFTEEYNKISDAGGQLIVVLQSDPKLLADAYKDDPAPFMIIADPEQKLYKEFDIIPAVSKEALNGTPEQSKALFAKFDDLGLVHGAFEGEELQLPAVFVIDKNLKISYAHYSKNILDIPSVDEMAELLR